MHNFKKQYGQNFLRGDRFASELVASLKLTEGDTVIEVGPGDGRVTRLLLATGAKVICIEIDYQLLPNLVREFGNHPKFQLINESILDTKTENLFAAGTKFKVTGSLPYNISKKIIAQFLTDEMKPTLMSFIVQEEVAQEYTARPPKGTFLSNWIGLRSDVKKLLSIPASQFYPVPKVNGAIFTITPKPEPANIEELEKLVKVAFASPRKTLWNNLRSNPEFKDKVAAAWEKLSLSPNLRAAEVEGELWKTMLEELIK